MNRSLCWVALGCVTLVLAGCKSSKQSSESSPQAQPVKPVAVESAPPPPTASKGIRVDAGSTAATKDGLGGEWLADTGFTGGDVLNRGEIAVENVPAGVPVEVYRTEHWGMTAFAHPVPNGKYTVKLHFAETYPGVSAAGQRVFSVNVEGKEIKDIDVFKEAGGARKALVKTAEVTVNDGKLDIAFVFGQQNPEINGIEIIPAE